MTSFAYPTGLANDRVRAAVVAAGYTTAVSTRPGWWRPATQPLWIPRAFVEEFSDATFVAAIKGGLSALGPLDTSKRLIRGDAVAP